MTATVRYLSPLVWSSVPATTGVRQAAPVVWTQNFPSAAIRQAVPVVWSQQAVLAYVRNIQAVQWIISPTPLQFRKAQALQWTQDVNILTFRKAQALQWTQDSLAMKMRALQAVLWVTLPTQGSVRQLNAYTLQQSSTQGAVRQINGYTLQLNRKPPITGGLAGLWPLIVADASIALVQSQLSVSAPFADSSQSGCNTGVTVAPLGALLNQYSGHANLYYNRRSFADAFLISGTQWLLGTITTATTIRALLSSINSAYAIALDPTDVNDGPVPAGTTQLTLTAATTSYVFQPGTTVLLMNTVALTTAISNVNLPGFAGAGGVGGPAGKTAVLMHFDGANNSTTFTDVVGNIATASGGAVISTSAPKIGSASASFPSGTAVVTIPSNANLKLTDNFTIEFWCKIAAGVNGDAIPLAKGANTTTGSWLDIAINTSNANPATLYIRSNGGTYVAQVVLSTVTLGVWFHMAITKNNGLWTLWVNGIAVPAATNVANANGWGNTDDPLTIGAAPSIFGVIAGPASWIDELRISKVVRYTANFTPPAAAFVLD